MSAEEIIKSTILGEEHLGENLKRICIEYLGSLKQENQQLKADYGTEAQVERDLLKEENQELKKQLESANEQINYLRRSIERKEETIIDLQDERIPYTNEYVDKIENQQKEFIKYLEDFINKTDYEINILGNYPYLAWSNAYQKILSKYKEINHINDVGEMVGAENEKNTIR